MPSISVDIVKIFTAGDKDKSTSLSKEKNTSFFSDTIEKALLDGEIDVAVHSAKDLDDEPKEDLVIAAMTKTISPYDCLVSFNNSTLDELPFGARIGTSSKARERGVLNYRGDLVVSDIRGNVDERIAKLDKGDFDAIVVAHAALIRLGLQNRMSQLIHQNIIKPHCLQGRLAIQVKRSREDLINIFKGLNYEQ